MTGGHGFLGSHLARALLEQGHDVTILDVTDRPAVPIPDGNERHHTVRGSILDKAIVRETLRGASLVYHLAAVADPRACSANPDLAYAVNVLGTQNVLEATPNGATFVFLSSAAVYGPPAYLPIDETHPLLGSDPYATSKRKGEELCRLHAGRLQMAVVRNFNTYGPGQTASYLIPKLIAQALRDHRIEVWSRKPIRDFNYVDDAVDALVRIGSLNSEPFHLMNLGTGLGRSVGDVVALVAEAVGETHVVDLQKEVSGSPVLIAETARARALLEWQPEIALVEGIRRTISWSRSQAG